jgi:general secretion pathway protein K
MTPAPQHPRTTEKGFALVIVIVIMLLATFLASQLILQVRTELQVAHNIKQRASGIFLAEAGISLGLFRLMDKPLELTAENEEYEHFFHGRSYTASLPDGVVSYYAVNESGKIDLNTLPGRLLEIFLEYHNVEPEQIQIILDSLQDWIDKDNLHRLNGVEKDYYETLTPPYIPRDDRIAEVSEFFLIKGTESLVDTFNAADVFTIYNSTRKINFNSLTPTMLDFITAGDPEKKTAYYEAQSLYINLNITHALDILGQERFDLLRPFLSFSSGQNPYYFIVSQGENGYDSNEEDTNKKHSAGVQISVLADVRRLQYSYLSWKEAQI